jgi:DNA mismatch repair protein MutL
MLEVAAEEDGNSSPGIGFRLSGYISPVAFTRSNRREITLFVNGRWVQDTPLSAAVIQAYHTLLMVGRYPLAVLFLELPPEEVDVNVHPAKAEVRFRSPERVFSFIQRSVRRAILAFTPVPQVATQNLWGGASSRETGIDPGWGFAHQQPEDGERMSAGEGQPLLHQVSLDSPAQTGAAGGSVPLLRLVGQIGATYLVAEGPDGLYLIDQHAAHERVLFEKLMAQHEQKSIPAQALLTPAMVDLPPASARLLTDQLPTLQHLGFQVDPFGQNGFQVRAVPVIFANANPLDALRSLVEDFEEDETPLQHEMETRIAGRVCKRLAVKAGQVLSHEEQRALLSDLEGCTSPRTCPHGRPTMIHLSVNVLERQFGRKGAR